MAWFKRTAKGIQTPTEEKMDVPKGLWYKSPTGKIIDQDELAKNLWYLEDKSQQLSIQQIQQQSQGWQLQQHEKPYFGYSASAFWLKVEIDNTSAQNLPKLLEITYKSLFLLKMY